MHLSKAEACRLCGIIPLQTLADEEARRAKEADDLFSALGDRTGIREWRVFRSVYPDDEEASRRLWHFLSHTSSCPPEVLAYVEEQLARKHAYELASSTELR